MDWRHGVLSLCSGGAVQEERGKGAAQGRGTGAAQAGVGGGTGADSVLVLPVLLIL